MATTHIPINTGKILGQAWYEGLRQLQRGIAQLLACQAIAATMIDGADYTLMEQEFGFQPGQGDDAKAELDSLLSKFTTDVSVSFVLAARNQAQAKFGVIL